MTDEKKELLELSKKLLEDNADTLNLINNAINEIKSKSFDEIEALFNEYRLDNIKNKSNLYCDLTSTKEEYNLSDVKHNFTKLTDYDTYKYIEKYIIKNWVVFMVLNKYLEKLDDEQKNNILTIYKCYCKLCTENVPKDLLGQFYSMQKLLGFNVTMKLFY